MIDIFFDTETTGLPQKGADHVSKFELYPRLVQLGFIVADGDLVLDEREYIVKPVGFTIPVEASNVHGISTEKALKEGKDLDYVLYVFTSYLNMCDRVIGHNVKFDIGVIGAEVYRRYGHDPFEGKSSLCTMESSKNHMKMPGKFGFKRPRLSELYQWLFNKEMGAAHTALQDIQNARMCFTELVKRGIIKE